MEKPFKELVTDVDHQTITEKIKNYVLTRTNIIEKQLFWNNLNKEDAFEQIPEIKELFDSMGLEIEKFSIVYIHKDWTSGLIHCDYNPTIPSGICPVRVLWPVYNCEKSVTKFYEVDRESLPFTIDEQYGSYIEIFPEHIKSEIGGLYLDKPYIIDPNVAHGIWLDPDTADFRLSASFAFTTPIEHLLY
jgi:hypothetical protein